MARREERAVQHFEEVVAVLTGASKDIEIALRKYAAACEVMGWRKEADAAWLELSGCTPENVSEHRLVWGVKQWVPDATLGAYDRVHVSSSLTVLGIGDLPPNESIQWQPFAPLAELVRALPTGLWTGTGEPNAKHWDGRRSYPVARMLLVPSQAIQLILDRIERWVFRASVQAIATLGFGSQVEGLWTAVRATLDEPLMRTGLAEHLDQIEQGIAANTGAGRRSALFACRTLFEDIANVLWLDPRPAYDSLPGNGEGGRLDVSAGNTKNRLAAYLHQHSLSGEARALLSAETERVFESLRRAYDMSNAGHDHDVTQADAELLVIATYLLLAEVAARTDLQPLAHYE